MLPERVSGGVQDELDPPHQPYERHQGTQEESRSRVHRALHSTRLIHPPRASVSLARQGPLPRSRARIIRPMPLSRDRTAPILFPALRLLALAFLMAWASVSVFDRDVRTEQ